MGLGLETEFQTKVGFFLTFGVLTTTSQFHEKVQNSIASNKSSFSFQNLFANSSSLSKKFRILAFIVLNFSLCISIHLTRFFASANFFFKIFSESIDFFFAHQLFEIALISTHNSSSFLTYSLSASKRFTSFFDTSKLRQAALKSHQFASSISNNSSFTQHIDQEDSSQYS
ncbi:MAG: hypothetical protein ACOZBL_00675 [Patescibacteria group bacterium]